jgi:hypothetical protein
MADTAPAATTSDPAATSATTSATATAKSSDAPVAQPVRASAEPGDEADQLEKAPGDRDYDAEKAMAFYTAPEDLFEVMIDQWGYNPAFTRGQLISREAVEAVPYDLDWALSMGTVRPAPEYAGRDMRSTTETTAVV